MHEPLRYLLATSRSPFAAVYSKSGTVGRDICLDGPGLVVLVMLDLYSHHSITGNT